MVIGFEGRIIYWRGPSPFLFVPVPEEPSQGIKVIASLVSYGWGVIPVRARIGRTEWKTSLFPKDGNWVDVKVENPNGCATTVQYNRSLKQWRVKP